MIVSSAVHTSYLKKMQGVYRTCQTFKLWNFIGLETKCLLPYWFTTMLIELHGINSYLIKSLSTLQCMCIASTRIRCG